MTNNRAKKASAKKVAAGKRAAKKASAKKTAVKKTAVKKVPARRPTRAQASAKKTAAQRPAPPRRGKRSEEPIATEQVAETGAERTVFGVEVEPGSLETTLQKVRDELGYWVKKGRYTRVRFKFRGKPILPDVPIGAVLAAEAVTFWWAGLLRALLATLGAGALLDVELVNDSAREVAQGKDHLLAGELDEAIAAFERAVAMDRDCAAGLLNLGVAYRLKSEREKAIDYLQQAAAADPGGPTGAEAQRLLAQLGVKPPSEAQAG